MGNQQSQRNEVGFLEGLTREELAAYEDNCRADPKRTLNNERAYLGLDLASETGFIGDTDSLYDVVQRATQRWWSASGRSATTSWAFGCSAWALGAAANH